ncbi:MAG: hypothetical protein J5574_06905, partial [Lachnospiraceae bacterium]|nr:hypothetical protein [Lachnospiraceae bacterium]
MSVQILGTVIVVTADKICVVIFASRGYYGDIRFLAALYQLFIDTDMISSVSEYKYAFKILYIRQIEYVQFSDLSDLAVHLRR